MPDWVKIHAFIDMFGANVHRLTAMVGGASQGTVTSAGAAGKEMGGSPVAGKVE